MGDIKGKGRYFAFLDLEKAYDKINRDILFRVIAHLGFSDKIVRIIASMYRGTKSKFNLGYLETEWVHIRKRMKQEYVIGSTNCPYYSICNWRN